MTDKSVLTYIVAPDKIENHYEVTGGPEMKGGFAVVRICRRVRRPILHHLVLKSIVKESRFKSCVLRPDKEAYQARLLEFDHPNVIHYYDFLEDDRHAYVVMPQCSGPTLWESLQEMTHISESTAQGIMLQIVRALRYIHSVGITHRDVTPDNLKYFAPGDPTLKLIDFGLCALDQKPNEPGAIIGTLLYIAPEVFSNYYSEALDVWSAGVIFHVMLAGRYPFNGDSAEVLLASMASGLDLSTHPWIHLSDACKDLLCHMLDIDSDNRINAANALDHEWFQAPRSEKALVTGRAMKFPEEVNKDAFRWRASAPKIDIDFDAIVEKMQQYDEIPNVKSPPKRAATTLQAPLLRRALSGPTGAAQPPRQSHTTSVIHKKPKARDVTKETCRIITQAHLMSGFSTQTTFTGIVQQLAGKKTDLPSTPEEEDIMPDMGAATEWDGTVATFSLNVGASLLSTPYAFSQVGIVAIPLLMFFTYCSGYTAHLMSWALTSQSSKANVLGIPREARDWVFLVDAAFGSTAKKVLTGFLIFELWGYVISYTVVTAVHMNLLVAEVSKVNAVFISSAVTFLLSFAPPAVLTRVSIICNCVFFATCALFVTTGFLLPEKAPASDFFVVDPPEIMAAAGILVFSSASHACYPAIMQSMSEPNRYPSSLRQSYSGQIIFYLALAVPGYVCFGNSLQQSLVENIGRDRNLQLIPGLGWMGPLSAAGMVIKVSAMQPLVFTPLVQTLTTLMPKIPKLVMSPLALGVSALCSALFADKMAGLINLIGSVLCMNIAFVMPVACYWRLVGASSLPMKGCYSGLLLMGCTFAVLGLLNSLGIV